MSCIAVQIPRKRAWPPVWRTFFVRSLGSSQSVAQPDQSACCSLFVIIVCRLYILNLNHEDTYQVMYALCGPR